MFLKGEKRTRCGFENSITDDGMFRCGKEISIPVKMFLNYFSSPASGSHLLNGFLRAFLKI